jgi:hypothetical protein
MFRLLIDRSHARAGLSSAVCQCANSPHPNPSPTSRNFLSCNQYRQARRGRDRAALCGASQSAGGAADQKLKGFQKVYLRAGETRRMSITLDRRSLAYYNTEAGTWDAARGVYAILVGSSSQDIELQKSIAEFVLVALCFGEHSGARSEKGHRRRLIERCKRSDGNNRSGGSNSDSERWQRERSMGFFAYPRKKV